MAARVRFGRPPVLHLASDALVDVAKKQVCEGNVDGLVNETLYRIYAKISPEAKAAIRQIRDKGYAAAYVGDRRPVTLVGINFRIARRNIDEPLFEEL